MGEEELEDEHQEEEETDSCDGNDRGGVVYCDEGLNWL